MKLKATPATTPSLIATIEGFVCDGTFDFGKHKGCSMVEVATSEEADYFLWIEENIPEHKRGATLRDFMEKNREILREKGSKAREKKEKERLDEYRYEVLPDHLH